MNQSIRLISTAAGISFIGTLPLGILNLSVAHLASLPDITGAISFAVAAALVEILTVRVSLLFMDKLQQMKRYYGLFRLLSVLILFTLAVITLLGASKAERFSVAFPATSGSPFFAGLTLSALNPLHVPFWMGWTVVLKSRGILDDNRDRYNWFVISIGMGTLMGFALYGLTGRFLIGLLGHWQNLLNWILGITLLITALVQLYKAVSESSKAKQQSIL